VKTPLSTSFNCAIGGIQALIKCTIEKQRLRVDESTKNILAQFRLKGLVKATKISVNPKSPKTFMGEMSRKAEALHLADRIAEMQEHKIHVPEEVRVVL
jgi:formylmethanofuran dehydrogenase subunit E